MFFQRSLSYQALAKLKQSFQSALFSTGIARHELKLWFSPRLVHNVENSLLGGNHRSEFRQDQFTNSQQISLALQHARKLCKISLEPILLLISQCRVFQIADHLVDVVLHCRDLTLRSHLN